MSRIINVRVTDAETGDNYGSMNFRVESSLEYMHAMGVTKTQYDVASFIEEVTYENAGCDLCIMITHL